MQTLILSLHIVVCVILVILVLLQAGKEGMGVIFGGGNASVFGSGGAGGILTKLTAFMALLFIFTSLSYTYVTSERTSAEKSVILDVKLEEIPAPPSAVPAQEPVPPPAQDIQPTQEVQPTQPVQDTKAADAKDVKDNTKPVPATPAPAQRKR